MVDITEIRKQFPILETKVNNYPLVYLDNAATTQKPLCVIDSLSNYYLKYNANVHRGVHYLSSLATDMFEQAREEVKEFLNAESTSEIIFTRGTTESINLLAHSFAKSFLKEEDTVLITEMEHHSNIVPWQIAAEDYHFTLDYLRFDDNGELMNVKQMILQYKPKLLAITYVSNTLGTINPVKEIIDFCHQHSVLVMLDAAQAVAHTKVDIKDLDADFLVFSGHKIYAPMGIGVLYGKRNLLDKLSVYQAGGEMIKEVTMQKTTYNDLPYRFEAGTPSVADAIGLSVALNWFRSLPFDVFQYEDEIFSYALDGLKSLQNIRIFGNAKQKTSCISFLANNVHHLDLGTLLDAMGVALRTGHHCAEPVMQHFHIEGTDRISFALYNTKQEIDYFIDSIEKALKMLR